MCMFLKRNLTEGVVSRKRDCKPDKDGYLIGYKVIKNCNGSIYYRHDWKLGLNTSDRGTINPSPYEIKTTRVEQGFHAFFSKEMAKKYCRGGEYRVIKIFYKPKDVVSYGLTCFDNVGNDNAIEAKSVVVTKCTVKSLKGV